MIGQQMDRDEFLESAVRELITKWKCHTVILYGSRARGNFTPASDYDLMGVRRGGKRLRVAEQRQGGYLDIFIFPENELEKVGENHLYMKDAKVVFQKSNFGTKFLRKLEVALKKKYKPLPDDEIAARRVWLHKMFDRCQLGDIEGNYRRSWLHEALLADYFNIRRKRYWGSKQSFTWLEKNDRITFSLFDIVLRNPTDVRTLEKLVERVSEIESGRSVRLKNS